MAKEINFIRPQEVYSPEDGKSTLKYRSYDGKDKYVQASDSPEGGGGGADAPLVVRCVYESDWQVNKTSQEVIQALDNGKAVVYFAKDSDGWHTASNLSTYGSTVELLYCSFYDADESSAVCTRINHVDNHIVTP